MIGGVSRWANLSRGQPARRSSRVVGRELPSQADRPVGLEHLGGRLLLSIRGLSPRRRALVVAVVVAVVVGAAFFVSVGLRAGPEQAGRAIPEQDRPGPVLLVPGYGGNTGGVQRLAEQIRATGRQ